MTATSDPMAVDLEQYHGNLRLSIFSKIQSVPPSVNAVPLLIAAGTIGELVALISNGDAKLFADCVAQMKTSADRVTALPREQQLARLAALSHQIAVLGKRHKRERSLIIAGKGTLDKIPKC